MIHYDCKSITQFHDVLVIAFIFYTIIVISERKRNESSVKSMLCYARRHPSIVFIVMFGRMLGEKLIFEQSELVFDIIFE